MAVGSHSVISAQRKKCSYPSPSDSTFWMLITEIIAPVHICICKSVSRKSPVIVNKTRMALAGMAQWTECWPVNQRVAGSIPSQGACLGCGPGLHWGPRKRQPHTDVSLPLFLFPFPSV